MLRLTCGRGALGSHARCCLAALDRPWSWRELRVCSMLNWGPKSKRLAAPRECEGARASSSSSSSSSRRAGVVAEAAAAAAPGATEGLTLYNTLSRQKEAFAPQPGRGNQVSMYVCGVTVYDYSHIGHARVYVAFDVLYRYLQHLGYDVTYVRNFTDVDDKIIARANASGEDPLALSQRFIHEFHADMATLNCLPPALEPRATDYIGQMIAMIQQIIDHGHAYAVEGDVYFEVDSMAAYGKLSGRAQDDNRAGSRVAVDGRKRGAADFALWKAAKPGEPTWESPWGPGRPGWHIECSAMIREVMGPVIDIHGGGRDLVFPHHENELAQSRAAAGPCGCGRDHGHAAPSPSPSPADPADFVRFWVHNGFVNVESEKMSKSLGNFFTIREVVARYHPAALRWFLVGTQYRQAINYTQRALEEASDRAYYLYQAVADIQEALGATPEGRAALEGSSGPGAALPALLRDVHAALGDDLNTPLAVAALSAPLKEANDLLTTKAGRKAPGRLPALAATLAALRGTLGLLGLWQDDPAAVLREMRGLALTRAGLTEAEVAAAIEERAAARAAKDYAAADAVRQRLEAVGVLIMDTPQGTTWRPGPRLSVAEEENAAAGAGAAS